MSESSIFPCGTSLVFPKMPFPGREDTVKNPQKKKTKKKTRVLGVEAEFVLIYRVFSAKSA